MEGNACSAVWKNERSRAVCGKEQQKQGKRLEVLEGRDGEMWRKVVGYIITAVIGIVIGFVFHQVGM